MQKPQPIYANNKQKCDLRQSCVRRAIDFDRYVWVLVHGSVGVRFADLIDLRKLWFVFRSYVSIKPFIQFHRTERIIIPLGTRPSDCIQRNNTDPAHCVLVSTTPHTPLHSTRLHTRVMIRSHIYVSRICWNNGQSGRARAPEQNEQLKTA